MKLKQDWNELHVDNEYIIRYEEYRRRKSSVFFGVVLLISLVYPIVLSIQSNNLTQEISFGTLLLSLFVIPLANSRHKTVLSIAITIHVANVSIFLFNYYFTHNISNLYSIFPLIAGISILNPLPFYRRELITHATITFLFHSAILSFFLLYPEMGVFPKGGEAPVLVNFFASLISGAFILYLHNLQIRKKQFHLNRQIRKNQQTMKSLSNSLKENTLLTAEIHHRIKNNLAVVSGMLNWQRENSSQQEVKLVLNDCSNRVMTMALLHKKLYEKGESNKIFICGYLKDVCADIKASMETSIPIEFTFQLERVEVDVDKATPCGLIVNEVVTNSFKHAFKGRNSGQIELSIKLVNQVLVVLIKDDGVGMPHAEEYQQKKTMGYQLIHSLTEQLEGRFEYATLNGTHFGLFFPLN